jgi:c-di-GMP-binding flagellar brake protein YcgR
MPDEKPRTRDLRAHVRFKVGDALAVVYPEKFLNKLGLGKSNRAKAAVNLSEGGVLVLLSAPLEEDTRVRVRVEVDKFKDVFECAAEVRWCRAGSGEGKFYAGLRFLDLGPADKAKIVNLRKVLTSKDYKARQTAIRQKPTFEGPA